MEEQDLGQPLTRGLIVNTFVHNEETEEEEEERDEKNEAYSNDVNQKEEMERNLQTEDKPEEGEARIEEDQTSQLPKFLVKVTVKK